MFFDRLGNFVTGEQPIIEEPIVESYYDHNRPVRAGFEKPEHIQEGIIGWVKRDMRRQTIENYFHMPSLYWNILCWDETNKKGNENFPSVSDYNGIKLDNRYSIKKMYNLSELEESCKKIGKEETLYPIGTLKPSGYICLGKADETLYISDDKYEKKIGSFNSFITNVRTDKEVSNFKPGSLEDVEKAFNVEFDESFKSIFNKLMKTKPEAFVNVGDKCYYINAPIKNKKNNVYYSPNFGYKLLDPNMVIDWGEDYCVDKCVCFAMGYPSTHCEEVLLWVATKSCKSYKPGTIIRCDAGCRLDSKYDDYIEIASDFQSLIKKSKWLTGVEVDNMIEDDFDIGESFEDLDEMSDYIQENVIMEANEASKKARKNAQEFMRREYGTAHPTSMTSKQRNRMKRWLKDNDYDPETGTIATDMKSGDGKAIRVNLGTNSAAGKGVGQKSNMPFYATANPFYPEEKYTPVEQHAFVGGRPLINMPKEYMKRHPSVSTGISKHEEGHLADYYGKIDDVVDRRIEAGEHITQSMKKGMDYSPTHTDVKEHIADLYSVQHNKYKDKLRFLNAFLSEDIHMQRKFKANWKDLCKNIYKKRSDDQPPIIDASSVETMRDSIKNMVSRTKANIKSYKAQLKTPLYQSGKNLLNRLIASGKDACDEYEKILRKWFIGKLLFKKVDYDDAKVMVDKAVWHDAKLAVDEAIRQSDGDIEIRREFLKKYINEFAVEYDMSITDVIQEMYQTAFEDYVFQEDYKEDEFVSREIILEEKISAAERNELDDDDFGLVYTDEDGKKVRKYPLTDENHIRQAVRFFSHCPDEHKPQLARKILKKANEHDMDTSNWETIHEWAKK